MEKKVLIEKLEGFATDIDSVLDDSSVRTLVKDLQKLRQDIDDLTQTIEDEE